MFTIELARPLYDEMLAHCQKNLPEEACGLVAGHIQDDVKRIEKLYLCENIDHSDEHFSIDPKEQLAAYKDAHAQGLAILGNFHSHPASPSRQSKEDMRLANDHDASYLILSLAESTPKLNSFCYDGKTSRAETLIITT